MTFVWPSMLWLLAALPLLPALYFGLPRRRDVPRFARLAWDAAAGRSMGWRRYLSPMLLVLALAILIIGTARPAMVWSRDAERSTVILAMDVSLSMRLEDMQPSRLAASQEAAKWFVSKQPDNVEIGIVAFAGVAFVAQRPTTSHSLLYGAIDGLKMAPGTAVGSGIVTSLRTIFPDQDQSGAIDEGVLRVRRIDSNKPWAPRLQADAPHLLEAPPKATRIVPTPVEPGSYHSAAIILLTDGATTLGLNPRKAGQLAADYGVRVYTVAFGSKADPIIDPSASSGASFDAPALQDIASKTLGAYFEANSADELTDVYSTMSTKYVTERQEAELAFLFAGIGALIAMVAAMLSLWWSGRVV